VIELNRLMHGGGKLCQVASVTLVLWFCFGVGFAADFSKQQIDFFEKRIRPLLAERCYECHQGHSAKLGL